MQAIRILSLTLVALFALSMFVTAEEKAAKKLEGTVCCAKCELKQTSTCATVIKVKEGEKDVIYFFDADGHKKYHGKICTEAKAGTVTGTVSEKDGKKIVTVTEVKYKD